MITSAQDVRVKRTNAARVALLGCGTVGREVAAQLLAGALGERVELCKVLVRDPSKERGFGEAACGLFTDDFEEVLAEEPDVVVELLGGLEPAAGFIERALGAGAAVVTANKTVVAHRGPALAERAAAAGVGLAFEGTVCAGVPVLAALAQLRGDRVRSIRGVVSGSCNFILTRLAAGAPWERALEEARQRGLVEPDPSADLSGRDCVEKACVLAAAAGYPGVLPRDVEAEGIERLTPEDLAAARSMGYVIKLVVELEFAGGAARARVGPALVPLGHALASVHGEENAVIISAELAGDVLIRGKGAGPRATASAVLGDLARVVGGGAARPAAEGRVAGRGEGRAGACLIRVGAGVGGIEPRRVFDVLEQRGVAAREVALSRGTAHVMTGPIEAAGARQLAAALAGEHVAHALVVPTLAGA